MPQRVNSSTRWPVPYRSVGLAVLLVVLGSTMLVSGLILCLASEDAALGVLKGWSLIILGSIVFVPGELVDEKYRLTPSARMKTCLTQSGATRLDPIFRCICCEDSGLCMARQAGISIRGHSGRLAASCVPVAWINLYPRIYKTFVHLYVFHLF